MRCAAFIVVFLSVGLSAAWVLALAWRDAHASVVSPGPASPEELLTLAVASVAAALVTWLVLGTTLEVLSHVPGRIGHIAHVWADRLTPALARQVVAFALGVGVGVAGGPSQAVASARDTTTSASVADPGFAPPPSTPDNPAADPGFTAGPAGPGFSPTRPAPVAPGFTPALPTTGLGSEPAAPGFTPAPPRVRPQADPGLIGGRMAPTTDDEVVVHRGDTLWSIAARHLGPHASDAEIAVAWPRWFDLNRGLIGDDPDHILPGQILHIPGADQTASVPR